MNPVPPENSAVTAAAPADAKVCGRIATPSPVLTGAVPTSAPSTLNVTVPLLGMGETVAERLVGSTDNSGEWFDNCGRGSPVGIADVELGCGGDGIAVTGLAGEHCGEAVGTRSVVAAGSGKPFR